jgi:hypothetical protein
MDEREVWMRRVTGDAVLSTQVGEAVVAGLRHRAQGAGHRVKLHKLATEP